MSAEAPGAPPSAIPVADRQRWIDDYLRDRLDAADREHFEIALLADDALREEVEADWLLRRTAHEALDAARAPTAGDSALAPRGRPPRGRRALDWRLAAAFVLGIGVAGIGQQLWPGSAPDEPPRLAAIEIVDVPEWRSGSAETPQTLELLPGRQVLRFAAPIGGGLYRSRLDGIDGTSLVQELAASGSDSGEIFLDLFLDRDQVGPLTLRIERTDVEPMQIEREIVIVVGKTRASSAPQH
jgi:hypothetical protein